MSYDVDSVTEVVLDAWMLARDVLEFHGKYEDRGLPQDNFLTSMLGAAEDACTNGRADEPIPIEVFDWSGESSGCSYAAVLVEEIAPRITGIVEVIVTWDSGDSFTGLLIKDGKVAECDVEMRVVKPEGW